MGFLDDFTGASARRDLQRGRQAYRRDLTTGRDLAMGTYGQAADEFSSYTQAGARSNTQWADLMGLNGADARAAAQGVYQSDPMFAAMGDRALRGIARGVAVSGQTGAGIQAGTNALIGNYQSYLDRLFAGSGQGMQAAAGRSGALTRAGDAQFLTGQQLASGEQSFASSMAASRSTTINNLLGVGSVAASFVPGAPKATTRPTS
jgi:hypothetical protein